MRLEEITLTITKGETPKFTENGILFIKSENVLVNELSLHKNSYISFETHNRMKRSQLLKGDVLFWL